MPTKARCVSASPIRLLLGAWLAIGVSAAGPAAAADPRVQAIRDCITANAPSQSALQALDVRVFDRAGSYRSLVAQGYWKRFDDGLSRILIRVDAPPELRDAAYLVIQKPERYDLFVYLPAIGRVRRLNARASSGSLFGTDFSYEDIVHLQRVAEGANVSARPDVERAGALIHILHSEIDPASGSAYTAVDYHIEKKRCVLLRADFFGTGGALRKQLVADPKSVVRSGSTWYASRLTMHDRLEETRTEIVVEDMEIDPTLRRSLFSERALLQRN